MTPFALPSAARALHGAAEITRRVIGGVVVGVPETLYTWQRRARMRHEMMWLDDRSLRDMGLDRIDVRQEATKPFWQP